MKVKDILNYIEDKSECRLYIVDSKNKNKVFEYFYTDNTERMKEWENAPLISIDFLERAILVCID